MAVLTVFPHCDMHLALNTPGANKINFRVFKQDSNQGPFVLESVTADCMTRLFAPHNEVTHRLEEFVTIDLDAETITATKVGTNLVIFQLTGDDMYIVARIQVHDTALAWWFGNRTITTALDSAQGHTQPSLYAMFSDDNTGTDRVGDITGHGFVALSSSDPTVFNIDDADHRGRLRGLKKGSATLHGTFLGRGDDRPVEVVDYTETRPILETVRINDLPDAAERHNILFVAEGFRNVDRATFNEIVSKADKELFSKPRHEPFATLAGSFNVFKAFTPSEDRLVTCDFQVTDTAVPGQRKGRPIPYEYSASEAEGKYEIAQLIQIVGLPKRGEARGPVDLIDLWEAQSLHGFDATKVDLATIEAWRASTALGFLEARDTFFGMRLGGRWADGRSRTGEPLDDVTDDDGGDALKALVRRAYEFYKKRNVARVLTMDPRRHPPELLLSGTESRTTALMTFLQGLRLTGSAQEIGGYWVPEDDFKPSRGLVVMIINETMHGGTSINLNTFVAVDLHSHRSLRADYIATPGNPDIKVLRRNEAKEVDPVTTQLVTNLAETIDTIAHELGHSFRLGDEYEEFASNPDFAKEHLNPGADHSDNFDRHDNITSLQTIFVDPNYVNSGDRKIDIEKVKWRVLPRIRLSARLTEPTAMIGAKIEATIDRHEAQPWEKVSAGDEVHLRATNIASTGAQLPLATDDAHHLTGLKVDHVDPATGKITLSSAVVLMPAPAFPAGSCLFLPHRLADKTVRRVIEPLVFANIKSKETPLNSKTEASEPSEDPDTPRPITDFEPPCVSARVIGVYEGAARWSGLVYRPSGTCKMRTGSGKDQHGEYCHVCKWLITNRVDPGQHALVDRKFYPSADNKKKKRKKANT